MKKYHLQRQDKQITDENEIQEIINQGKYASIAMCKDNRPYLVAMNYGYDSCEHVLYFHSSKMGKKLDFITTNSLACVEIIENQGYSQGQCNHKYRSVVIDGRLSILTRPADKKYGMNILIDHLEERPSILKKDKLRNDSIYKNIVILRLDITSITGKTN
ncbi:MAG: pyridoxamine 5'-phosphate oxidase family protein [Bacillota bacterium]